MAGLPPEFTQGDVEVFRERWAYSSAEAERELGYQPTSLRDGLRQAVSRLRVEGLVG